MADNLQGGEEAAFDAHVETFELDRAIGLGIDARALMEIVYNLPGLGQEDEDEQAANICAYADTMNALRTSRRGLPEGLCSPRTRRAIAANSRHDAGQSETPSGCPNRSRRGMGGDGSSDTERRLSLNW